MLWSAPQPANNLSFNFNGNTNERPMIVSSTVSRTIAKAFVHCNVLERFYSLFSLSLIPHTMRQQQQHTHTHHSPRAVHRDRYSYDLCEWTHQRRGIIRPVKAGFLKLKEYYYYYRYLFWLLLSSQVFLINEHHGDKDRQTSNNVCLALTPLKLGIVAQH